MDSYPGHELSIPQLFHALHTKLECGELIEATNSNPSRISELERDAHRVHASIRFALNGFSPINRRLPPEALAMIPSFLVRNRDRITATHVCRHWRDTFLSTPTLWDVVPASNNPDKTTAYLERSRGVPLNVSIASCRDESTGWKTSFRALGQHSHRFRAMRLWKHNPDEEDVFGILENPLPNLTELDINIPSEELVGRREDPYLVPSLKSLILHGDIAYLRWFQLANLRKLGVVCFGWVFRPRFLFEQLTKAPLLEELELFVHKPLGFEVEEDVPPVVFKHLKRLVFQGSLPEFLHSLFSHIVHPNDTKFVITHYLRGEYSPPTPYALPQGAHPPIPTTPKYIRYQVVHDEDSSETRTCIDLISTDGRHTLIETRYGWPEDCSLSEAELWDLDPPCLDFLQTIDLSFVERLCFEGCSPDPGVVGELLDAMCKLETLVVVNCDPYLIFMAMQGLNPPGEICPLLCRLVVLCDLDIYTQWDEILRITRARAAGGSPLKQVTFTSSFSELLEQREDSVELLEEIAEVKYDFGRNIVGWEWWKE